MQGEDALCDTGGCSEKKKITKLEPAKIKVMEEEEMRPGPDKKRSQKQKSQMLTTAQKRAAQKEIDIANWHGRAIQEAKIVARRRAVVDAGGVLSDDE